MFEIVLTNKLIERCPLEGGLGRDLGWGGRLISRRPPVFMMLQLMLFCGFDVCLIRVGD